MFPAIEFKYPICRCTRLGTDVAALGTAHRVHDRHQESTWRGLGVLSSAERVIMIRCCYDHDVAFCGDCARSYQVHRLGADWFHGKTDLCPQCRADLSDSIRLHLRWCKLVATRRWQQLPAESEALRDTSGALREGSSTDSRRSQVCGRAEVEAELQKRRKPNAA
jgi:hypothetical protein